MIVREIPSNLRLPESRIPRSEGIHVSGIIRAMAITNKTLIVKPEEAADLNLKDYREITDPVAILRMSMGLAWEDWYIPQLEDVEDHAGEMELDGIFMTPDGESLSVIITSEGSTKWGVLIHEVKCSFKSCGLKFNLETQFMWLTQIKAYCKGRSTRYARLHVLFVCGDYKYPISPKLKIFDIEFTQHEIDSNWDLLKEYRDIYGYERET